MVVVNTISLVSFRVFRGLPMRTKNGGSSLLRSVLQPRHPDIAGQFTQVEHNLVGGDCNIHEGPTNVQDRAPYLVDVVEGQRRPHGPLGFWFHGLRPKAGKTVTVRDKVDAVSIR